MTLSCLADLRLLFARRSAPRFARRFNLEDIRHRAGSLAPKALLIRALPGQAPLHSRSDSTK